MGKKLMLPDITSLLPLHRLWSTEHEILGSPKIPMDGGILKNLLLTFLQAVSYMPLKRAKFSHWWCFPNVFLFPHVCYWSSVYRCAVCNQMSIARRTDWITGILSHQLLEDALWQLRFLRFDSSSETLTIDSADSAIMAEYETLIKLAYRNEENGVQLISLNNRNGLFVIL